MAMIDPQHIHDEMDRAYVTFARLARNASRSDLNASSDGTRWTNQQLLFHMMFGYLVVRRLLPIVRFFDRLPERASRSFAAVLNAATRPFHLVNYLGSWAGGTVLSPARTEKLLKRTIEALHRKLGKCRSDGRPRDAPTCSGTFSWGRDARRAVKPALSASSP
jgi:hypothetical protein